MIEIPCQASGVQFKKEVKCPDDMVVQLYFEENSLGSVPGTYYTNRCAVQLMNLNSVAGVMDILIVATKDSDIGEKIKSLSWKVQSEGVLIPSVRFLPWVWTLKL